MLILTLPGDFVLLKEKICHFQRRQGQHCFLYNICYHIHYSRSCMFLKISETVFLLCFIRTSECFLLELTYIFHYSESHVLSCVIIVFSTTNVFIPGFSVYSLASFSAKSIFSYYIFSL
jgi:hypothetical protein